MQQGLILLEENLMRVYRGMSSLRDKEGIGFSNQKEENEEMYYPNRIIRLLHEIADFI